MDKEIEEDLNVLGKTVTNISVTSEDEYVSKGVITWILPKPDLKKLLNLENIMNSNYFSIGSPSYCTFYFQLRERGLVIVFKKNFPENAWIEVRSTFNERITGICINSSQVFSVNGKDAGKQISIPGPLRLKCLWECLDDFIIQCYLKIKVKKITCNLDNHTIHAEIINRDLYNKNLTELDFLSDVTVCVEGCDIKSFKACLSKISFFKELFSKDESKEYFKIENISLVLFQSVINYLHTNSIPDLNFKLCCELYVVADDLEIFDLKYICSSYLGVNLTKKNVFIVLSLSVECHDISLKKECIKFIKSSNFDQLVAESVVL